MQGGQSQSGGEGYIPPAFRRPQYDMHNPRQYSNRTYSGNSYDEESQALSYRDERRRQGPPSSVILQNRNNSSRPNHEREQRSHHDQQDNNTINSASSHLIDGVMGRLRR